MEGFEVLERVREAKAKLLSVERLPAMGATDDDTKAASFLLVFDAGRILLSPRPAVAALHAMPLDVEEESPGGLVSAVEEEPWWRLLGCPLSSLSLDAGGAAIRLGFLADRDLERQLLVAMNGEMISARLLSH